MYSAAVDSAYDEGLIQPVTVVPGPDNEDLTMFAVRHHDAYWPVLDELACFAGGLVGMGAKVLDRARDLVTAEKVGTHTHRLERLWSDNHSPGSSPRPASGRGTSLRLAWVQRA
jgi:hypothetical protein